MTGLTKIAEAYDIEPSSVSYFTHGTTVGVNTVIQRKGVNLCLFTTENFEDVLEVARLRMPDPYDLFSAPGTLLLHAIKFLGLKRILSDGSIDTPLELESVRTALTRVKEVGVTQ